MTQPPNSGAPVPPPSSEPSGLKYAIKKSFTDWARIRQNRKKSIPILLVAAFVLAAAISDIVNPDSGKTEDTASKSNNTSSSASASALSSSSPTSHQSASGKTTPSSTTPTTHSSTSAKTTHLSTSVASTPACQAELRPAVHSRSA